MSNKQIKLILIIIFFSGICIFLYPFVSQYFNARVQSHAIADYDEMLSKIKDVDYSKIFDAADKYNQELYELEYPMVQYKKLDGYSEVFNIDGSDMIGYITIDKIKVELPIYGGTSASVLNVAVGHLEGTSLPVGGINTHSVLSAHRGLPSAKLFTNLDKLEIGDIFVITVLDRKLTYQVDKITIAIPSDISYLELEEDKDYVTLMTCTPYGLNTHRLLVRGSRIENIEEKELIVVSEASVVDRFLVILVIAVPILLVLLLYVMFRPVKGMNLDEGDLNVVKEDNAFDDFDTDAI